MLRRLIETFVLMLILAAGCASAEARYWCGGEKPLPIEYPRSAPFTLAKLMFSSPDFAVASSGQVDFTETGAERAKSSFLLIEFLDENGKHILSVPIHSLKAEEDSGFYGDEAVWVASFLRSENTRWTTTTPGALAFGIPSVPATCPASARLIRADIRYASGKSFRYTAPNVTLDPILVKAPLPESQTLFRVMPLEFTGRIHVDPQGRPTVAELGATSGGDGQWLKHEVSLWTFSPALSNGQRMAADISFYLVVGTQPFNLSTVEQLRTESPGLPVFVFRFVPPPPGGKWELQLANFPIPSATDTGKGSGS